MFSLVLSCTERFLFVFFAFSDLLGCSEDLRHSEASPGFCIVSK